MQLLLSAFLWLLLPIYCKACIQGSLTTYISALSGEAWVLELLCDHPDQIHTELGVSLEVFSKLIQELRHIGYHSSRHVSLEEQLAIFLYMCVTGLTIRHVGERFQRSNDTISQWETNEPFTNSSHNLNLMVDIFERCCSFSPPLPFTQSLYSCQRLIIDFPVISTKTPNFGHISRMPSEK